MSYSIGILEVQSLVAAIYALDQMLKTADVALLTTEKRLGGRLVSIVIKGSVSSVSAALEQGRVAASSLGKVKACEIIANPHHEILKFLKKEM